MPAEGFRNTVNELFQMQDKTSFAFKILNLQHGNYEDMVVI